METVIRYSLVKLSVRGGRTVARSGERPLSSTLPRAVRPAVAESVATEGDRLLRWGVRMYRIAVVDGRPDPKATKTELRLPPGPEYGTPVERLNAPWSAWRTVGV
jgi:hypothetical protein